MCSLSIFLPLLCCAVLYRHSSIFPYILVNSCVISPSFHSLQIIRATNMGSAIAHGSRFLTGPLSMRWFEPVLNGIHWIPAMYPYSLQLHTLFKTRIAWRLRRTPNEQSANVFPPGDWGIRNSIPGTIPLNTQLLWDCISRSPNKCAMTRKNDDNLDVHRWAKLNNESLVYNVNYDIQPLKIVLLAS